MERKEAFIEIVPRLKNGLRDSRLRAAGALRPEAAI